MDSRCHLFDEWAESYDDAVQTNAGFPFAGYDQVLGEIFRLSGAKPGMRVLDLGTGTGNLAGLFAAFGCTVIGVDFSSEMLAAARKKVPDARFVRGDLTRGLDLLGNERFDLIVSAYVFHEFDLSTKVSIMKELVRDHLAERGRMVIGDIAFPTIKEREEAQQRWASQWDEEEHYWAADEAIAACGKAGLRVRYVQVSCCGGVFSTSEWPVSSLASPCDRSCPALQQD